MMKKAIVAIAAVGVVIGLRPVVKRIGHKARQHCEQMAAQCKQMMAGQSGAGREAGQKMPDHCEEMAEQFERRSEAVTA
jgi:hypothetical protein